MTISLDDPFWQGVAAAILGGIVGGAFGLLGAWTTNQSAAKRERYARLSDAMARVTAGFADVAGAVTATMAGARPLGDTNEKISYLNRAVTDCHLLVKARMRPILWHLIRGVGTMSRSASQGATISRESGRAIGDLSITLASVFQDFARREIGLDDRNPITRAWQRFRVGSWYDQFVKQLKEAMDARNQTGSTPDETTSGNSPEIEDPPAHGI